MGNMVDSLLWVMQDLNHQPYGPAASTYNGARLHWVPEKRDPNFQHYP